MHPITILSFGYLHPWPQDAPDPDITVDLRRLLADPAHRPEGDMLDMTGLDAAVRDFVWRTDGAHEIYYGVMNVVFSMACFKPVTVAFGCAGGRHRSVVFASEMAREFGETHGITASVEHLHVHLPRVIRTS